MGLLNDFFASTASIAKKSEYDATTILKSFNEYKSTLNEKEQIINTLPYVFGQRKASVSRLKELLDLELVDINAGEQKENDLISDIQVLEHSKKIKRVNQLENCLAYAETKYRYVYELLCHIYATLKSEADLLEKLSIVSDLRKYRKLVDLLKSEFVVEKTVLKKIDAIGTFHKLLFDLVKGEQILQTLNSKEKRIIATLKKGSKVGSISDKWVRGVLEVIQDEVYEAVATGVIDNHYYAHFEFVNRPEFVELARKIITNLRARDVSEQMINAFVYLFREKYNSERE